MFYERQLKEIMTGLHYILKETYKQQRKKLGAYLY